MEKKTEGAETEELLECGHKPPVYRYNMYICPKCSKGFCRYACLKTHYETHKNDIPRQFRLETPEEQTERIKRFITSNIK